MQRPPLVDPRWSRRAVLASLALHLVIGGVGHCTRRHQPRGAGSVAMVDVELAPPAPVAEPLPDEVRGRRPVLDPAAALPEPSPEPADPGDVAVDARVDGAPSPPHPDAGALIATADAAMPDARMTEVVIADAGGDDAVQLAIVDPFAAEPALEVPMFAGDAALAAGSPGAGADPISPGTNANLLAYFPAGHVVTALIRFDRLRDTTWQEPTEKLFRPMPDHVTLIGDRALHLADLFDTIVISSPRPDDPRATTLVGKTRINRASLRDLLDQPETPVTWTPAKGGMLGARRLGTRVVRGDRRQFLSPYLDWIVLAQLADLGGLTMPSTGDLDTVVATVPVPAWLDQVRQIEAETGSPTGPALIVTLTSTEARLAVPDLGLGVASVPGPERVTIALEIVPQGFIVRGNLRFARDADAIEMVDAVTLARQRALDSTVLSGILRRSRVLNAVKGLSLDRRGARLSYATSLSVADAEGLLALAGRALEDYFRAAAAAAPAPGPAP